MQDVAEVGDTRPRPRRLGRAGAAVVLVVAGGAIAVVGVVNQDPDPVAAPHSTTEASTGQPSSSPAVSSVSAAPASPSTTIVAGPPVAAPTVIIIPAIGVESELITVGLNPDGTLAVPPPGPTYDNAAWYTGSPKPGETGASIILGHVDSAENGPSIFYRLGELATGDEVRVDRHDGTTAIFVVDEVRGVPKHDFPTVEVYRRTDDPQLRLITCGGDIGSDGHYVDNTIVFLHQI